MNKDKNVPFTLQEEKKLAKPRVLIKLSIPAIILGFFTWFAGLVLTIIGFATLDESIILVCVGLPLFCLGLIFFVCGFYWQKLNNKIYKKLVYRSLVDSFGENKYEYIDLNSVKQGFLKDRNIMNLLVDSANPESYIFKKGSSVIEFINITKSTSLVANRTIINDLFSVSNQAMQGEDNVNFTLEFKGVFIGITNTNLNLSYPIDIRNKAFSTSPSMIYSQDNILKTDDELTKNYNVYLKNPKFIELVNEKVKNDLNMLASLNLNVILMLDKNQAYILIKDFYIAPKSTLRRDDEKIYEEFAKINSIYFKINKLIDSIIEK